MTVSKFEGRVRHRKDGLSYPALLEQREIDWLTRIPNKRHFEKALRRAETELSRVDRPMAIAVVLLDLDKFKDVNDNEGHKVGDRLLKAIARSLKASVAKGVESVTRPTDVVARLSGDEFALILQGRSEEELREILFERRHGHEGEDSPSILESIHQHVADSVEELGFVWNGVNEGRVNTHLSVGVAFMSSHEVDNKRDLLNEADLSMYEDKRRRWGSESSR